MDNTPTIEDAKALAVRDDKEVVIILHLDRGGQLGYASYGTSYRLCQLAKRLADQAFNAIMDKAGAQQLPGF